MARGPYLTKGFFTATKGGNRFGNRRIEYKSDLEKQIMGWLDGSPDVMSWVYEPLDLATGDRATTHRPDFVVCMADGSQRLVEGKSHYWVGANPTDEAAKEAAAAGWCLQNGANHLLVWYEDVHNEDLQPQFRPFFAAIEGSDYHDELVRDEREEDHQINLLMSGARSSSRCRCGYLAQAGWAVGDIGAIDCPCCGSAS